MAHELLTGESPIHLYRHDVESLFYIILLMCARHTFGYVQTKERRRKNDRWLDYRQDDLINSGSTNMTTRPSEIARLVSFQNLSPILQGISSMVRSSSSPIRARIFV